MSLDRGTRLGHYEVTDAIGAGGMGEVYKATDTRLDRIVALKVLAAHLAESPERKERFEREARTISKLNHPNICTLHDIGSQDGIDFLVMEYIEGQTLGERLERGPLSRDEALGYAVQITDALTKAHRAGIVHRDLKPGNVMLTKEGVKLLDFGLAKLVESDSSPDDSDAPTVQKDLTHERAVVGTPRYMSPEQLEGGRVDARTDLYALGLVLREMSAVEDVNVERVASKCLERDPDERWQSAKDLGDALRWIASSPESSKRVPSKVPVLVASVLTAALAGSVVWWASRGASAPSREAMHFRVNIPASGIRLNEYSNPIVISRDGSRLVLKVVDEERVSRLFLRSLNELEATPISGTERGSVPVISWDGESVAFTVANEIRKVPLSGGSPVTITQRPRLSSGTAWGPDGTVVLAAGELLAVSEDGGVLEPLAELGGRGRTARWPQFLPDGKTMLLSLRTEDGHRPALLSLETGEYVVLEELGLGQGARFVPPGYIVWASGDQLFAVAFDLDRLETLGPGVSVLDGVYTAPESQLVYFTTSDTGTLVYLTVTEANSNRRIVLVDRDGRSTELFQDRGLFWFPRFSPDGRKIAVARSAEPAHWDIWVYDVATGTRERLATGTDGNPVWSPDGHRIAFTRPRSSVWIKTVGTDDEVELLSSRDRFFVRSYIPDGSGLATYQIHPERQSDIVILSEDGATTPWLATEEHETTPELSPDGKWLAYVSEETDRAEVYVRPYPGPGQKVPVSSGGGRDPIWSPDGRELYYRYERSVMAVTVETSGNSFNVTRARELFTGPYASYLDTSSAAQAWYDVSPDGKSFLMIETTGAPSDPELRVILNWDEELKRLVPPGD